VIKRRDFITLLGGVESSIRLTTRVARILAPVILCFTSVAVFAEDAGQLTCSGMMIEPPALSQSPETVILTLGPARKVTLDFGQGVVNARRVSDNKIQLKFRTKDFEGEYFHYTGDLYFIYKSGRLMKLTCPEARKLGLGRGSAPTRPDALH
jgi:hypothetical protein